MKYFNFFIALILIALLGWLASPKTAVSAENYLSKNKQADLTKIYSSSLKSGDLLFIEAVHSEISDAITRVTAGKEQNNYSHVGIIRVDHGGIWLLHASPRMGSECLLLHDYIEREFDNITSIDVYRLKQKHSHMIMEALERAEGLLGLPYNHSFVQSDSSLYCSDMIERIFRDEHIFKLNKMTYIDPTTKKVDVIWQNYFDWVGVEVPEGEMGCNPNGLALSNKIELLGTYCFMQKDKNPIKLILY